MNIHKEKIGIRMVYHKLVMGGSLTTLFRPDGKKYFDLYPKGKDIQVCIVDTPGNDIYDEGPVCTTDKVEVKIVGIKRLQIKDLQPEDFVGSSPDVQTVNCLAYHLGLIYNRSVEEFGPETYIVKINLRYLNINGRKFI